MWRSGIGGLENATKRSRWVEEQSRHDMEKYNIQLVSTVDDSFVDFGRSVAGTHVLGNSRRRFYVRRKLNRQIFM